MHYGITNCKQAITGCKGIGRVKDGDERDASGREGAQQEVFARFKLSVMMGHVILICKRVMLASCADVDIPVAHVSRHQMSFEAAPRPV